MKTLMIVTAAALLTSCMTTTSKEQLEDLLGQPISAAMASFRKAPDRETVLPDGGHVYTWRWNLVGYGEYFPPMDEVVTIWTDGDGTIIQWTRNAEGK